MESHPIVCVSACESVRCRVIGVAEVRKSAQIRTHVVEFVRGDGVRECGDVGVADVGRILRK